MGIDIPPPPASPKTWEQCVAGVMASVLPVRHMLQDRGVTDAQTLSQIDTACAACVLTGLLRDVRVAMIQGDRLYIPTDQAAKHGLDLALMHKALKLDADRGCDGDRRDGSCDCALMPRGDMLALRKPFRMVMRDLVGRAEEMLTECQTCWRALPDDLSRQLHRHVIESRSMLRLIARNDYDTLTRRPKLGVLSRMWNNLRLRWWR